mmetsp:Transcript_44358/g.87613  ORF Transcript_44358/g.87613 Transcript_44358/m.87613 type:complete len:309 (+) Transcript_44358:307-1233(+)
MTECTSASTALTACTGRDFSLSNGMTDSFLVIGGLVWEAGGLPSPPLSLSFPPAFGLGPSDHFASDTPALTAQADPVCGNSISSSPSSSSPSFSPEEEEEGGTALSTQPCMRAGSRGVHSRRGSSRPLRTPVVQTVRIPRTLAASQSFRISSPTWSQKSKAKPSGAFFPPSHVPFSAPSQGGAVEEGAMDGSAPSAVSAHSLRASACSSLTLTAPPLTPPDSWSDRTSLVAWRNTRGSGFEQPHIAAFTQKSKASLRKGISRVFGHELPLVTAPTTNPLCLKLLRHAIKAASPSAAFPLTSLLSPNPF